MRLEWQELGRRPVFKAFTRQMEEVDYRLPDGREDKYYIQRTPDTVSVVAFTSDRRVLMAKQFRPGHNKVVTEIPGGYIGKDHTPEEAAHAELQEEIGYTGTLQFVTSILWDGYSTRVQHVFVATDCVPNGGQRLDDNEFIERVIMSLEEFRAHLRSGQLSDVNAGYLALDHLQWL